ncbi:MAG: glutathione-independent formaldehyde dehydrogenase, partial [Solirubrobacteraceae bacterium]
GRAGAEPGMVFGHENMGIVEEVGDAVVSIARGDRVVVPFNISCGFCKNCIAGYTAFCLTVNPGMAGGAYGYVNMGPYRGGQAEYLRVPFADFNCLKLPGGDEHEDDFVLLSDIFPTGYHGAALADVRPGETVAVYGAGPVGLLAAYSSLIRGASRVFIVDRLPDRLAKAQEIGCIPINFDEDDPAEQICAQTDGEGADKGIEAVGYQCHRPQTPAHSPQEGADREDPSLTLNWLIASVRATGRLGIPGAFFVGDPGAPSEAAGEGRLELDWGTLWQKGIALGTGQCDCKRYMRRLRDLITAGRAQPSFIVSHRLPLREGPDAFAKFDRREQGYTKVALKPAA